MTEAITSTALGLGGYFLLPTLKVDFDWMIRENLHLLNYKKSILTRDLKLSNTAEKQCLVFNSQSVFPSLRVCMYECVCACVCVYVYVCLIIICV